MEKTFAQQLNAWYQADHRDLPFRRLKDPYAIWVSEVMAQQTRIESMLPYYEKWMMKWPAVKDLAEAEIEEVLHLWQGLGYYNRARKLHEGARKIVCDYNGKLPETKEELLKIPGIGPYTAGAVASICFQKRTAAVDGNVLRVMARVDCILDDVTKDKTRAAIEKRVEELMEDPSMFTQALMELGARVCTPKNPACLLCPVQGFCKAYHQSKQEHLPVKTPKKKPVELNLNTYVILYDQKILISTDDSDGLMKGLCRLPQSEQKLIESGVVIDEMQHVFSHRIWNMKVYLVKQPIELDGCFWHPIDQLHELSMATAHRKILKKVFSLI